GDCFQIFGALMSSSVKIVCLLTPEHADLIPALAETLELDVAGSAQLHSACNYTHFLYFDQGRLSLRENTAHAPAPTSVDFLDPGLNHRRETSGKSRGLGSAIGLKKLQQPLVLDATAGLGRDAFILASLGCRVKMLERSPLIHALLADGLQRARAESAAPLQDILERMSLQLGDARQWCRQVLQQGLPGPDVIYLDPMFPPRQKSARVKKDISMLQKLLGSDADFSDLLATALDLARYRVVVKRPGKKSRPAECQPDYQVPGSSCHFDVYLSRKCPLQKPA
ncbi:MAG: class I SAM-dependent methyltransferase, partial [Pseudohongiellaceae bacterium]